jgi:hypothetical protein
VISSRSVCDQIAAGAIAPGEALERLADLRKHHRHLVARTQSIQTVYERQLKIAKDPGRGRRSSQPLPGAEPLTMKSVSHSEARWALLPAHVIRCNGHMVNGGRCRREAEPGSVVCRLHGGAAPQVRKRAAERLIMSADHASQKLLEWLDDPDVPYRVRAEIAQDVLDRAGLASTQAIKIVPAEDDPILRFFEDAFSDPNNWEENPPQPAIEE